MGTASGKITLYMKNMLPVIATANPSFDWIEREGCGVLVKDLRDIGAAVDHIRNHYDDYVRNVKRFYDDTLDFTKRFASVCTLMNHV
jgi:hypothetical protein